MGQEQMLTVLVPLTIRKRGGRTEVITPDGTIPAMSQEILVDTPLVKALARAFRWRKLLETGVSGTVAELATAEQINESYVGRVFRMTLLAPDIVESIVARQYPNSLTMAKAMKPFPVRWTEQRVEFRRP